MSSLPKCDFCERAFSTKYTLKNHIDTCKSEGSECNFEEALFKCLEDCRISFKTSNNLRHHLIVDHNFEMNVNYLDFDSFEEFEVWLQNEEKTENVRFSKARGVQRNMDDSVEKHYLYCSRTGKENLISEDTRKRRKRSQGSCKINSGCTSQIVVTKYKTSGKCSMVYYSTHYGHPRDMQNVNLSKKYRKDASPKLTMGVSAHRNKGASHKKAAGISDHKSNSKSETCNKFVSSESCTLGYEEESNHDKQREQVLCPQCNQSFTTTSNMLRHQRRKHNLITTIDGQENMNCVLCNSLHPTFLSLDNHLEEKHDVHLKHISLRFSTMTEFEAFKREQEEAQPAFFCKWRSNESVVHYRCNRSGQSQGHTDAVCPARIVLTTDADGLCAEYQSVHVGHKTSSKYLLLTKEERIQLAGLLEKQTFESILDDIRTKASIDSLSEFNATSNKDMHNIVPEFHLVNSRLSEKDFFSIDTWVKSQLVLGDSCCVLAYKKQGAVDSSGRLREDDFLLIIMTKYQRDLLMDCSNENILIHSINKTIGLDFQLTTLVIIDNNDSGYPVAFCISSRVDTDTMKFFFNKVKANSQLVECNIFMSNDTDIYYNAWISEMTVPKHRLLCTWHVDEDWRDILKTKVKEAEKKADVYKGCRVVLETLDEGEFYDNLENFLEMCEDDPDTEEFYNFFNDTYPSRPEMWAYCFQKKMGINTDVFLESLHRTLKYCYLDDKVIRRLDVCIDMLLRYSRQRISRRVKNKASNYTTIILNSHKNSESIEPHMIEKISENKWQVSSRTHGRGPYTVQVDKDTGCEDCPMTCSLCEICIHQFECECIDYSIRGNFCKHIHACVKSNVMDVSLILDVEMVDEIENEIEIVNMDTVQLNNIEERQKLRSLLDTLYASTANVDANDIAALSASIEHLIDKSQSMALFTST